MEDRAGGKGQCPGNIVENKEEVRPHSDTYFKFQKPITHHISFFPRDKQKTVEGEFKILHPNNKKKSQKVIIISIKQEWAKNHVKLW